MKPKLIFSTYDSIGNPYYSGGGAIAIHEIAKRLTIDYRIEVVAGAYQGCADKYVDGVKYSYVGYKYLSPKLSQLVFALTLPWWVLTRSFDVWVESFTPPISTSFLPIFTRKPVVGLVHMLSGADMRRKYHLPFESIEKIGLKTYQNFITTSDHFREKIVAANSKARVVVIPDGIDSVKKISRSSEYYLYIGRLEVNQKGLDLLILAMSELANKDKLVICGSGSDTETEKLLGLIAVAQVEDRVSLVGRKTKKEIKKLARGAKAILVTSRFETFSMVSLEALSMGVPLVTFNINGLRWIPNHCRIVVPRVSAEALAATLNRISKGKVRVEPIIERGLLMARGYTWDGLVAKYDQLIKSLL